MTRPPLRAQTLAMRFRPHRYVLLIVVAVPLMSAACSSTPRPPAASNTATAAPASGASASGASTSAAARPVGGTVHLTDFTDNDGPTSTVILSGAVGDHGEAHTVNPDGSVDPEHEHQLDLALTHGSFRLDIADLDRVFVGDLANLAVNTTTCSGTASASAAAPVVAGSGTGSYKGISGTFTLTITLDEVFKPTACSETSPALAQLIVITGSGAITFG
jgi:hypothetical protein